MEQVSTADFKLVSKAYDMAKQHGQGKMLTSNLGTVIENDNVQEWATTIIDGLNSKQNAIGGDTYRGVAV